MMLAIKMGIRFIAYKAYLKNFLQFMIVYHNNQLCISYKLFFARQIWLEN